MVAPIKLAPIQDEGFSLFLNVVEKIRPAKNIGNGTKNNTQITLHQKSN
jgi:hypothetical protein